MYAIVKAGARQERVTVGEVLDIDRVEAAVGATVSLPLLLVVEGGKISTPGAGSTVSAEVLDEAKGPKIDILRYKSKTGYRRRQGFRAKKTRIKVTAINSK